MSSKTRYVISATVVFTNFCLAVPQIMTGLPTNSESRFVAAGLSIWRTGNFEKANEVPPLSRMVAAAPILAAQMWLGHCHQPDEQKLWAVALGCDEASACATQLACENFSRYVDFIRVSRFVGLLWWCIGAWLILRWSNELHVEGAGLFGLVIWAFDPNILARECISTPDLPAAVMCLASSFAFFRWLRTPGWHEMVVLAVLVGISILTEFTALTLLLIWPMLGLFLCFIRATMIELKFKIRIQQIAIGSAIVLWMINAGYAFSRIGIPLGELQFHSRSLTVNNSVNCFQGTAIGKVWLPLPAAYFEGLDRRMNLHDEYVGTRVMSQGFNIDRGKFSVPKLLSKLPLGLWMLLVIATIGSIQRKNFRSIAVQCIVWLSLLFVISLAISPASFLFPMTLAPVIAVSLAAIGLGGLAALMQAQQRKPYWLFLLPFVWIIASSLACYPRGLYYLNETSGGGDDLDAQIANVIAADGGQDFANLKAWIEYHPKSSPIGLSNTSIIDPQVYGVNYLTAPVGSGSGLLSGPLYTPRAGPQPGYFAIDLASLATEDYAYFRMFQPIYRAGASILIYLIDREDAELARRRLGMAGEEDLRSLKRWIDDHPEVRPLSLACHYPSDPRTFGIQSTLPPSPLAVSNPQASMKTSRFAGWPGYYVVDTACMNSSLYSYFKQYRPIEKIGDSLFFYRITIDDIAKTGQTLPLPISKVKTPDVDQGKTRGFVTKNYRRGTNEDYNYTVFVPHDYQGETSYPTILFLHGYGDGFGDGKKEIPRYLNVGFPPAVQRRESTFGFIAVFPQVRAGLWSPDGDYAKVALEILEQVEKDYKVDAKRVYLTGLSSGGKGVWELAARYPKRWAAIIPVSTNDCDPKQAEVIKNIPCWCFHNRHDLSSPPIKARAMIEAMRKLGGRPIYTEFAQLSSDGPYTRINRIYGPYGEIEAYHNAWDKCYSMDELYDWMLNQSLR